MIDRRKSIPLYVQLKEEILKNIKSGVWEEGSQIPTEKELMNQYKIGRATVREAISRLVNEGYIYKKHGIGTFVAGKRPLIGFEPIISFTSSLEVRGIKSENIIEEEKIFIPDDKLMSILKWNNHNKCLYLKRLRYANDLPLAIEESYFLDDIKKYINKFDLTGSLAEILIEKIGVKIDKIEQTIIPRFPTESEQKVLKINRTTSVLELQRWIYINEIKEPFYYVKFVIPGNI